MTSASTLRDGIAELSPPWFRNTVAVRLLYSIAIQADAFWDICRMGAKAHMPRMTGYAPSALPYMGSERQLDRYALESDVQYAARLQTPHDTHRGQGGPRELINQLQLMATYRNAGAAVPVRAVSNSGVWWSRASLTSEFVQTHSSPNNWVWDAFTTRWFRGWVIIDTSAGPWTVDIWGTPGTWGDGGTWGSDATVAEVAMVERIVRLWKSAHETVQIIVTFDASLYEATDASPPNPNGTSDTYAWQSVQSAIFGRSVT
jgi:hypothetical protein